MSYFLITVVCPSIYIFGILLQDSSVVLWWTAVCFFFFAYTVISKILGGKCRHLKNNFRSCLDQRIWISFAYFRLHDLKYISAIYCLKDVKYFFLSWAHYAIIFLDVLQKMRRHFILWRIQKLAIFNRWEHQLKIN